MNSEQKEISSKKRRKPSAESGNRSEGNSSHNQLNKSSSKRKSGTQQGCGRQTSGPSGQGG